MGSSKLRQKVEDETEWRVSKITSEIEELEESLEKVQEQLRENR